MKSDEDYSAGKNPGPWARPICCTYLLSQFRIFFVFPLHRTRACRFVTRQRAFVYALTVNTYTYSQYLKKNKADSHRNAQGAENRK